MLNNTQELVEKSFYEALRLVAVAEGYLADDTILSQDHTGRLAWETQMKSIANTMGFAVEIFGVGSSQSKETKKVPRIVLISHRITEGEIGNVYSRTNFADNNPSLSMQGFEPIETFHLHMNVQLVSNSAKQDRVLTGIMRKALGQKKYLPLFQSSPELFLIVQTSYFDILDSMEGLIDKIYNYEVPDLFLEDAELTGVTIHPITDITTHVNIAISEIPLTLGTGNITTDNDIHVSVP